MTQMTSQLVKLSSSGLTMTSREIAELTGKRHDNVLRDIDDLLKELSSDLRLGFKSSSYVDSTGKTNRQYEMDRDATYCLMAGYDVNARMRIIKRWQELEQAQAPNFTLPNFTNPAIAARAWADMARNWADEYERRVAAESQLSTVQQPSQSSAPPQKPQPLLPPREAAFIHAWWNCLGNQTVTASDLYRTIATKQCQELHDSSGALLGDVAQWTPKKLSYAMRRWSQLPLDDFTVLSMGKTSRGITWRLERKS